MRDTLRDAGATALLVLAVLGSYLALGSQGVAADNRKVRCAALLDKYVVMRQRAADPKTTAQRMDSQVRESQKQALEQDAMSTCVDNLGEDSARCAEASNTADEFERCFR